MIYLTIICVILALLCGFVFWMWKEDKKHCHDNKTEEAKRLYGFIDDLLDRKNAENFLDYVMSYRIKYEIQKTLKDTNQPKQPEMKIEKEIERGKAPPIFSQKR